jgi:hypothetical protein
MSAHSTICTTRVRGFAPWSPQERALQLVRDVQPAWTGPYHGADWGFSNDPTTLVRCWIHDRKLWIEYECYEIGVDIDKLATLFDTIPGARNYVIRGDSARPETVSYMQQHGYPQMESVEKWSGSVEDGIAHLRQYEQIIIHPRCTHALEEARLYSYRVDRLSGDVLPDVVDRHNHIWDAVRYALAPLIRQGDTGFLTYLTQQVADARKAKADTSPEMRGAIPELGSGLALSPAEIAHIRRTQGNPIH